VIPSLCHGRCAVAIFACGHNGCYARTAKNVGEGKNIGMPETKDNAFVAISKRVDFSSSFDCESPGFAQDGSQNQDCTAREIERNKGIYTGVDGI
jgi:hypothetical protein